MLTALTVLFVGAAFADQPIAACPDRPDARLELTLRREAVAISDDLTIAEVRTLYAEIGKKVPHEPLGFYALPFHYAVEIERPNPGTCTEPTRIRVGMVLDGRRIVLGKEVMKRACLRKAALAHYRRHADANGRAFMKLAGRVQGVLADPAFLMSLHAASTQGSDVEPMVKSALESALPTFDTENRDAQAAVDTPNEVKQLEEACATAT